MQVRFGTLLFDREDLVKGAFRIALSINVGGSMLLALVFTT